MATQFPQPAYPGALTPVTLLGGGSAQPPPPGGDVTGPGGTGQTGGGSPQPLGLQVDPVTGLPYFITGYDYEGRPIVQQLNSTTLKYLTAQGGEDEGGVYSSGGGGLAVDPYAALNATLNKLAALVSVGGLADDEAEQVFQQAYTIAQQRQNQWQDAAEQERLRTGANIERGLGLQSEATQRARVVTDLLGSSAPVPELNIPLLEPIIGGPFRGTPINIPAMFDQGQGGLASVPSMPQAAPPPPLPQYEPIQPALGGVDVGTLIRGLMGSLA